MSARSLLSAPYTLSLCATDIDVCLSGCLEHGEDFAREFILTTFKWGPHWLNERELARRPWLHQANYVQIDRMLSELVPEYFRCRKLESEYATRFFAAAARE